MTKPMTKTEARKHLADAKRSLSRAQQILKPTPAWIAAQLSGPQPTEAETEQAFFEAVLAAEASLEALRGFVKVPS